MIKYILISFILISSCVTVPQKKISFFGKIEGITLHNSNGDEYSGYVITPVFDSNINNVESALLPLPRLSNEYIVLVDSNGRALQELNELTLHKYFVTGVLSRRISVTDIFGEKVFYKYPSNAVTLSFRIINIEPVGDKGATGQPTHFVVEESKQ